MTKHTPPTPISMTAGVRNAVTEWLGLGCTVEIKNDGTLRIVPPRAAQPDDPFDAVDMRR